MRILALDASTTAVGWTILLDGNFVNGECFVPDGKTWQIRIRQIHQWMDEGFACDEIEDELPDVVAYERATGNRSNMATNRKLGAVEWVCWNGTDVRRIPFIIVTASQVRATGCHKKAIPAANAIAGYDLRERHGRYAGDVADAIGVGLAVTDKLKLEALNGG